MNLFSRSLPATTAQIVDGALVVNLSDAESPCVWRMDLAKVHAAAVEVRPDGAAWQVGFRGPKSEFSPLARYVDKALADKALGAVSSALMARPAQPWTLGQIFVVAFFIVVGAWVAWLVTATISGNGPEATGGSPPGIEAGVPQDADKLLAPPSP